MSVCPPVNLKTAVNDEPSRLYYWSYGGFKLFFLEGKQALWYKLLSIETPYKPAYTNNEINSEKNHQIYMCF